MPKPKRKRPKWIRARVERTWDGVFYVEAQTPGYRPGDGVVVMSAAEARELRRKAEQWDAHQHRVAAAFKARKGSGS